MIYLDNAATTPCSRRVVEEMLPYFETNFGNPESLHEAGSILHDPIYQARMYVSGLFGDHQWPHVVFTSGGTEANNLAILGASRRLLASGKTHLITSMTEHKSVLEAFRRLENQGFQVTYLKPIEHGLITAEQVKNALRSNTGFVSIMFVNNETGCVNQVAAIGRLLDKRNVLFHVDCVQAAGCYEINHRSLCADFLTVSAHKINGPKGIGALWVRSADLINPILCGGEQEMFLRPGTQNVPGIIGFGEAAKAVTSLQFERAVHIRQLEEHLFRLLKNGLEGFYRNFSSTFTCPKVASYFFDGVDGETLSAALSLRGVCVSTGAACNSQSSEPSYVLLASGLTPQEASQTIRVSFSDQNTMEEMEEAADIIIDTVSFLRNRAA